MAVMGDAVALPEQACAVCQTQRQQGSTGTDLPVTSSVKI